MRQVVYRLTGSKQVLRGHLRQRQFYRIEAHDQFLPSATSYHSLLQSRRFASTEAPANINLANSPKSPSSSENASVVDYVPAVEAPLRAQSALAKVQSSLESQATTAADGVDNAKQQSDAAVNGTIHAKGDTTAYYAPGSTRSVLEEVTSPEHKSFKSFSTAEAAHKRKIEQQREEASVEKEYGNISEGLAWIKQKEKEKLLDVTKQLRQKRQQITKIKAFTKSLLAMPEDEELGKLRGKISEVLGRLDAEDEHLEKLFEQMYVASTFIPKQFALHAMILGH